QAQRKRRAAGDALPAHRDAGVPVPLQVAEEFSGVLGQSLRPAPRNVRLLPAPPLRPSRDGGRRQALLQSSMKGAGWRVVRATLRPKTTKPPEGGFAPTTVDF